MNNPLTILHVEDDLMDAEIIHNKLSGCGIEFNTILVNSREKYLEHIRKDKLDLILCDYSLPLYSGIEALALAKSLLPDIPFIFCSGTIGEENAVEALKLGATDYIIKDNLTRLCTAVKRAIAEAEEKIKRKKMEEQLKKSEERYRLMTQSIDDAIWDLDAKDNNIWWSEGFKKLFGYDDLEKFSNQDYFISKIHPDDVKIFSDSYSSALKEKKNYWSAEFRFKKIDDSYAYVLDRGFIIYDDKGTLVRIIGSIMDITERKAILESFISAKERAEESDRLKSEFLAQISHEIRTPLNVIMSYAGLLNDELGNNLTGDLKTILSGMENAGRRLIRTVELILNMSIIQIGKYDPYFKKVALKPLIKGIVNEFANIAASKELELEYSIEASNASLYCDEYSVIQMLQNLIDNAIKYTNAGKVFVRVYNDEVNRTCIDVKDTGIGIADEFIPKLYKPFMQEFTGYSRKYEGNGLGLALTKNYADINKAGIKYKTAKGEGTTFTLLFNENELRKEM